MGERAHPSPIPWENRRRTLRMFLHEFRTPGEKFLVWILRCGDRIRHEFHHCPLSLRLAHHGAVWLYLVRAIFFGGGYSGNPSPIAASSNIDLGKDNLRVPPLRKLLHRLTRAKPIQNRAAQGRSCGRRLNGMFAESIRGHDERQDKTKLFHCPTLSQISDARDKTPICPRSAGWRAGSFLKAPARSRPPTLTLPACQTRYGWLGGVREGGLRKGAFYCESVAKSPRNSILLLQRVRESNPCTSLERAVS